MLTANSLDPLAKVLPAEMATMLPVVRAAAASICGAEWLSMGNKQQSELSQKDAWYRLYPRLDALCKEYQKDGVFDADTADGGMTDVTSKLETLCPVAPPVPRVNLLTLVTDRLVYDEKFEETSGDSSAKRDKALERMDYVHELSYLGRSLLDLFGSDALRAVATEANRERIRALSGKPGSDDAASEPIGH
jgi:hypothetical protein